MCDSGAEEDVDHFWWFEGEFERHQRALVDAVHRMGAGERLDEFGKVVNEGKVALLLGNVVEGVSKRVLEEVGEHAVYWLGKWWQRRMKLLYGKVINGFLVFHFCLPFSLALNSWTQHILTLNFINSIYYFRLS